MKKKYLNILKKNLKTLFAGNHSNEDGDIDTNVVKGKNRFEYL